jgi:hypothetical protein
MRYTYAYTPTRKMYWIKGCVSARHILFYPISRFQVNTLSHQKTSSDASVKLSIKMQRLEQLVAGDNSEFNLLRITRNRSRQLSDHPYWSIP